MISKDLLQHLFLKMNKDAKMLNKFEINVIFLPLKSSRNSWVKKIIATITRYLRFKKLKSVQVLETKETDESLPLDIQETSCTYVCCHYYHTPEAAKEQHKLSPTSRKQLEHFAHISFKHNYLSNELQVVPCTELCIMHLPLFLNVTV